MHERPIKHLVDSLISIGAKIEYLEQYGYPPIKIKNSQIKKNIVNVKGNVSSQFLTSLILSSSIFSKKKNFEIHVDGNLISRPYIDITLKLVKVIWIKNYRKKK